LIKSYLRRWHILTSLLYKGFGGKGVAFTATLLLTLTGWLNILSVILIVSAISGMGVTGVSTKGFGLIVVITTIWGTTLGISWLLGQSKEYKIEAHHYLKSLRGGKQLLLRLTAIWLILSYVMLFPLSLYFYGI
jgi:hypothetical protein